MTHFSSTESLITATIDLSAVVANWQALAKQVAPAECSAVVKTNAYGLGAGMIAPELAKAGCKSFFVATLEGGLQLRERLDDSCMIAIFHGVLSAEEAALAAQNHLLPVLNSRHQIALWQAEAKRLGRTLPAALHVDTGMCRLGLNLEEAQALANDSAALSGIQLELILSHLANSTDRDSPVNPAQLELFRKAKALFPKVRGCFGNSGGIQLGKDFHADLVRPGGSLYGINPRCCEEGVRPVRTVVTLTAPVIQVQTIQHDATVGYCGTYPAPKGTRLATVGIGYADGILRTLSNKGHAWVAGHKVPYAGLVSMDLLVLDISKLPEDAVKPGDRVEIYGEHVKVEELGKLAATSPYELFTGLGPRVRRVYVGGSVTPSHHTAEITEKSLV